MRRSERLILISMCLSLAAVVSAVSSLNVALPDLARATGASTTELQWIVDAYALVFAGLLLPAGAIGDRVGRRTILLLGLAVFGSGALVATQLSDPNTLIAVRAVMGLGAAMIMPTTLSIITATFSDDARGKAIGVWSGVAGGSALVGLLASGLLLEQFSWSSVFYLNVTLALVGAVMTLRFVPRSTPEPARLDAVGGVLSSLGLTGIVWGFIEGPSRGWTSVAVLGGFAAGTLLLTAFTLWELRRDTPLLDPRLFKLRGFSAGSLSVFVQFFAVFGVIFVALQYLQFVLRYSPLQAGAALAPAAVMTILFAPHVPRLVDRVGVRRVAPAGLLLLAAGLLVASTMGIGSSYWPLLGGVVLLGLGMALASPPATTAIVESLPDEKQGVASAVNDTAREVGGALGIAVLGSVLANHAGHLGPQMDAQAVVDGYQAALQVGAGALIVGALAVIARAPGRKPKRAPAAPVSDPRPAVAVRAGR